MPYYRCQSCLVTSYSAATYSTVGTCPECSTPLNGASNGAHAEEPSVRRSLPGLPGSPSEARRAVDSLALPDETRDSLALIVSELVTNSVRHAGAWPYDPTGPDNSIELSLTRTDDEVHVEVHDRGPGFALSDVPRNPGSGGLGFVVVDALSKAWGVAANGEGCTVWCSIDVPQTA